MATEQAALSTDVGDRSAEGAAVPGAARHSRRRVYTGAFLVGTVATIADWSTLWGLVWIGVAFFGGEARVVERWAVVPGCLVGLLIQFFGNRNFSFGVRGEIARELLVRQMWRFGLVEGATLVVIWAAYNSLREFLGIDFRISRAVVGLAVYWGFSIPLWHWVFSTKR